MPTTHPDVRLAELAWEEWRGLSTGGKLRFALRGLRDALRRLWRQGWRGRVVAVVGAPIGFAYLVATVVRDGIVYRAGTHLPRRPPDRRSYLRHRFGGTQRLVHWRERRVVATVLARAGPVRDALDVPAGYGRFAPVLTGLAGWVVCADIDRTRLGALRGTVSLGAPGLPPAAVAADVAGALPFRADAFELVFTLRYLQHVRSWAEQEVALAELARVSRRWVVVSYYRRSNLHALVHGLQRATRVNRRRGVTMVGRRDFEHAVRAAGLRPVRELAVLPGVHAQRLVLLEKVPEAVRIGVTTSSADYTPKASSARSVTQ